MAGHRKPARKVGAQDRHASDPARREGDAAAGKPAPAARNAERPGDKRPGDQRLDETTRERKPSKRKASKRKLSESKEAVRSRKRYAEDPDYREKILAASRKRYVHADRLWTEYGMTIADYDALLARQNGVCRICKRKPEGRKLAVDHCHVTGMIRGLLCSDCNLGVGNFKDNPVWMRAAGDYMDEAAARLGTRDCLYVRRPQPSRRAAGRTRQDGVSTPDVETDRVTFRRGPRAPPRPRRG
jgi:Autographiviridae endonuclease VII